MVWKCKQLGAALIFEAYIKYLETKPDHRNTTEPNVIITAAATTSATATYVTTATTATVTSDSMLKVTLPL